MRQYVNQIYLQTKQDFDDFKERYPSLEANQDDLSFRIITQGGHIHPIMKHLAPTLSYPILYLYVTKDTFKDVGQYWYKGNNIYSHKIVKGSFDHFRIYSTLLGEEHIRWDTTRQTPIKEENDEYRFYKWSAIDERFYPAHKQTELPDKLKSPYNRTLLFRTFRQPLLV